MEDLREIIDKAVSGDNRARESLYRTFAPKMFGVCLRYAKDYHEAEDNLQDGFIKVFTSLKDFRGDGSFEGWVRRIMVTTAIDRFRSRQRMMLVDEFRQMDRPVEEKEERSDIPDADLVGLIQELPPRYRMVFNLYVMEGLNHNEIGRELGISEGTSKSNLFRAREILKNRLKERMVPPGITG